MYAGHYGIALGAKGLWQEVPLWVLLGAAFSPDLIGLGLRLAGAGAPEALATSLPGTLAIAAVLGLAYLAVRRERPREAGLVALLVLSHLPADFITATVYLWPGGGEVGLHLYEHPLWDLALEGALAVAGWLLYRRSLPVGARRSWAAWLMIATVVGFHVLFLYDNR